MLSTADLDACGQALTILQGAASEAASAATPGLLQGVWAKLIGADSSIEAAQSDATATQNLADAMAAKLERWRREPWQSDNAGAVQFVRDCGTYADTSGILATMSLVSVSGAAKEVGSATAADLGQLAEKAGGLAAIGSGVVLVVAVVVGLVYLSVTSKRGFK